VRREGNLGSEFQRSRGGFKREGAKGSGSYECERGRFRAGPKGSKGFRKGGAWNLRQKVLTRMAEMVTKRMEGKQLQRAKKKRSFEKNKSVKEDCKIARGREGRGKSDYRNPRVSR